jgi:hypothetical protein
MLNFPGIYICVADHTGHTVWALGLWVRIPLEVWMSVCVYSVFVPSCVQVVVLWQVDPPSKESYRLCKRSRNWKSCQGPTKGCKATDTFVLSTKFLNYTLILSINKPTALILSTFNWKSGGGLIFSYNFLSPLLSSCTLPILWFLGCASTVEPLPSLGNGKRFVMRDRSDCQVRTY